MADEDQFSDRNEESDDNLSAEEDKLLEASKCTTSKVLDPKEKRERSIYFSVYRDFLLYTRSATTTEDCSSPTQNGETEDDEKSHSFDVDDKGYLRGEFFEQAENDEELGFAGDLSQELNLMNSDNDGDVDLHSSRTFQDSEPEIRVVPSSRFVKEISDGNSK